MAGANIGSGFLNILKVLNTQNNVSKSLHPCTRNKETWFFRSLPDVMDIFSHGGRCVNRLFFSFFLHLYQLVFIRYYQHSIGSWANINDVSAIY
jgi:hypothetical protein